MTPPALCGDIALFLDLDGTLLEHREHPQAVSVDAALRRLLGELRLATEGALALITGRSIADLDQLLAPLILPAAGQHGMELRLASGALRRHAPDATRLRHAATAVGLAAAAHPGLLVEDKGMSLALHYRNAPQLRDGLARAMRNIAASLGEGFTLQEGKFVFELKPSGRDKGTAIVEFTREAPFSGRLPVFVGDDLTDEHGFEAVNALGGHSVKVGRGDTHARWRLADTAAVIGWLSGFAAAAPPLDANQPQRAGTP
jgi:trehalose 6-phosphate phosphatase